MPRMPAFAVSRNAPTVNTKVTKNTKDTKKTVTLHRHSTAALVACSQGHTAAKEKGEKECVSFAERRGRAGWPALRAVERGTDPET